MNRRIILAGLAATLLAPHSAFAQARPAPKTAPAAPTAPSTDPASLRAGLERKLGAEGAAALTPPEAAMLMLEQNEAILSRTRTAMRLSAGQEPGHFAIDLARYNMGPALRLDAMKSYGARNVDKPAAFGVGPHVGWRFVFRPEGQGWSLVSAERRVIGEAEGKTLACAGIPCLDLMKDYESLTDWQESAAKPEPGRRPYPAILKSKSGTLDYEEEAPAHTLIALGIGAGFARREGQAIVWPAPGAPVNLAIDRNLGQDFYAQAVVGPLADGGWLTRSHAVDDEHKPVVGWRSGKVKR